MRPLLLLFAGLVSMAGISQPIGNEWLLPFDVQVGGITPLPNGHSLITGQYTGTLDYDPGPDEATFTSSGNFSYDAFIIELDQAGAYVRGERLSSTNYVGISSCHLDAAGNIYLAGSFSGTADLDPSENGEQLVTADEDFDAFFLKLTNDRELVWGSAVGGSSSDHASSIITDQTGNVYVAGNYSFTVDFDPGPGTVDMTGGGEDNAYLLKLDQSGTFQWVRKWHSQFFSISLGRLIMHPNGDIYASGSWSGALDFDPEATVHEFTSTANSQDVMVIRMTTDGGYVSAFTLQGVADQYPVSIALATDGDLLMAGNMRGTMDVDPGPADQLLTATGSFVDGFVARFAAAGTLDWGYAFGGADTDQFFSIVEDAFGNIDCLGSFIGEVDLDPTAGVAMYDADLYWDACLMTFDPMGSFLGVLHYGAGIDAQTDAKGLAPMTDGSLMFVGRTFGPCDMDPGPNVGILQNADPIEYQPYICRVDQAGNVGIGTNATGIGMRLYPNPATEHLVIEYPCATKQQARILDVSGRTVATLLLRSGTQRLDVSALAPGLYTLSTSGFSERFIIE